VWLDEAIAFHLFICEYPKNYKKKICIHEKIALYFKDKSKEKSSICSFQASRVLENRNLFAHESKFYIWN